MKKKIVLIFIIFILAICEFAQSNVFARAISIGIGYDQDGNFTLSVSDVKCELISSAGGRFEVRQDFTKYIEKSGFDISKYNETVYQSSNGFAELGGDLVDEDAWGHVCILPESGYRFKNIKLSGAGFSNSGPGSSWEKEITITDELYKTGEDVGDRTTFYVAVDYKKNDGMVIYNAYISPKMISDLKTISVEFTKLNTEVEKKEYGYLDNENGMYTIGGEANEYAVRIDADCDKFESVTVDNTLVDSSNYTIQSGSTIVTFNEEYMNSLSEGEHILSVKFTDGVANTNFTVAKSGTQLDDDENSLENLPTSSPEDTPTPEIVTPTKKTEQTNNNIPKTGDEIYIVTIALILIVLGNVIYYKRKK